MTESIARSSRPQREDAGRPESDAPLAVMPSAEVYDEEYRYWPWGQLIRWTAGWVQKNAPRSAIVFDYMCGTGFLLSLIQEKRADLRLGGCDINASFVDFATRRYDSIAIQCADARGLQPVDRPGVILCTAGLHHLPFDEHETFLDQILGECGSDTSVLIGEEVIGEHSDEKTRRFAALRLSKALIEYGFQNNWPSEQIDAAIDVLKNDVLLRGEYKRSASQWERLLRQRFSISESRWIWEAPSGGGDIVYVCRRR